MKSGTTNIVISTRLPRNGRSIASARSMPRTSSIATTVTENHAVRHSDARQTGSRQLSAKLSRPTHGWSGPSEKSYWTNATQSENTSGKIVRATTIATDGAIRTHRMLRSNHEEAAEGRLLTVASARVATSPCRGQILTA